MKARTAISLGDLIRAAGVLKADLESARMIAAMLKLAPDVVIFRDSAVSQDKIELSAGEAWERLISNGVRVHFNTGTDADETLTATQEPLIESEELFDDDTPDETEDDAPDEVTVPARLSSLESTAPRIPSVLLGVDTLRKPEAQKAAPEMMPLLPVEQTRGILSRVLAKSVDTGPVDLEELIARWVRGEVLKELPRQLQPTLSRGVQLLVDRSESMGVFAQDSDWMIRRVREVVGESNLRVLFFSSSPLRAAGTGARQDWQLYEDHHLPAEGTVVAALTDLGIGGRGLFEPAVPVTDWIRLAARLRSRQCPLLAFVPYGPDRWPAQLAAHMTTIQWDWVTNTASIHKIAAKGLPVPR